MDLPPPTQCSDDVGVECASFGTAREVPVSNTQPNRPPSGTDLSTDAERVRVPPGPAGASAAGAGYGGRDGGPSAPKAPSYITISGEHGMIQAVGLPEALKAGVNFQLGYRNEMTVYQNKDGTTTTFNGPAPRRFCPNKQPITDNQNPPEERHLREITQAMAGEWRSLGRELGLRDATLDQIDMEHARSGTPEVIHQMLRKWKQSSYPATLHMLAKALATIGRGDLADKLGSMS